MNNRIKSVPFLIDKRKLLALFALTVGAISILFGAMHTCALFYTDRVYDRELVFLVFSGAVLIFCGLLNIMSRKGLRTNSRFANLVSISSTIFLVLFCLSLTPFFKAKLNYLLIFIHLIYLIFFAIISLRSKQVLES